MTDSNSKNNGTIVLVAIICIAAWFCYAAWSDSSRNNEIETTKDPARLAYLLLDYRDEEYKSSATETNNEITVKFNLGEYSGGSEITLLDESRHDKIDFSLIKLRSCDEIFNSNS